MNALLELYYFYSFTWVKSALLSAPYELEKNVYSAVLG